MQALDVVDGDVTVDVSVNGATSPVLRPVLEIQIICLDSLTVTAGECTLSNSPVQLSVTLSHTQEEMGDKGGEGRDLGLSVTKKGRSVTKKGRLVTLSIVY